MKIVVLVVITDTDTGFKRVWMKNEEMCPSVKVVYVYGNGSVPRDSLPTPSDFRSEFPETFENIVNKTLDALEWTLKTHSPDYIVRTNMSTLFNFTKLKEYIVTLPRKGLYAGPFIGHVGKRPLISGTCIIMTPDITEFIVSNKHTLNPKLNEDVALSELVNTISHYTINVKRLDFIDRLLYHKCFPDDKEIFCFRFKSSNRHTDVEKMEALLNSEFAYPIGKECELPIYDELFSKTPTLITQ